VEDAAHALPTTHRGALVGTLGSDATVFSFYANKTMTTGEGGMLVINDDRFQSRAEIIWEKGTNRTAFYRGEVDKYGWVDVGSSFLPSELTAAFLWAQLENLGEIQRKRGEIWSAYAKGLSTLESKGIDLPQIHSFASNNYHIFFIVLKSLEERSQLITHLKASNIDTVFHYQSLHKSLYYAPKYSGSELPNSDRYTDSLLRLPLHGGMKEADVLRVIDGIKSFWE